MRHLKLLCMCAMLLLSAAGFAQIQITGHVTDSQGETVIGANVSVKGTTNGTITNVDGNFTLTVDNTNGILVVSYIGYKTEEIKMGG